MAMRAIEQISVRRLIEDEFARVEVFWDCSTLSSGALTFLRRPALGQVRGRVTGDGFGLYLHEGHPGLCGMLVTVFSSMSWSASYARGGCAWNVCHSFRPGELPTWL